MKRTRWIVLAVVAVVVAILASRLFGSYDDLVAAREAVKSGWAEVDNQLRARSSKLGSIAEAMKGAAPQERELFAELARARAALTGARTAADAIAAGQAMASVTSRLPAVVENHPRLRSDEALRTLLDEAGGTGDETAGQAAFRRYDEAAGKYNELVRRFPTSLYAGLLGFREQPCYPMAGEAGAAPGRDSSRTRRPGAQTAPAD
jgi:LemA protein